MQKMFPDSKAVSPVIGVMLMIVVTVILAAVVSSYTGSIKSQDMAPQATFVADASAGRLSINLQHLGGDTIDKRAIQIVIESGYPPQTGYVDIDKVSFNSNPYFLNPGDEMEIRFEDTNINDGKVEFEGDEISQTVGIGEPFRITIIDTDSGQTIYSTKITLRP
jgi:flagellin-like protein